jgi:hypothetical protein
MAKDNKPDPMFDGIVNAANKYAKHQQDIAHQSAGIDPDTGKPLTDDNPSE